MKWLDRQSFLGSDSDEVLAGLTVGIVGIGGGGSHVAQQLAHLGLGGFVLVDPDVITLTNLNRLVGGTRKDVVEERRKVDIAARVILAVNPEARIEKCPSLWQEASGSLKTCDVVIGGLDDVRARDELDAFTRRFLIPYVDMGMDVHKLGERNCLVAGQVVLTGPGQPCLRCLGVVTEAALAMEAARYGDAGSAPQVVWPNGVLASTAVGLFTQMVASWHKAPLSSAFLEYDGNLHTMVPASALKRLSGRKCPHYSDQDLGDPVFDIREVRTRPAGLEILPSEAPLGKGGRVPWWSWLASFLKH